MLKTRQLNLQIISDYIALTKPIIVLLMLTTTLAAMIVATDGLPRLGLMIWTGIGGAFAAAGAGVLNNLIDRKLDQKMARTRNRPLPDGRIGAVEAFLFGIALCTIGLVLLIQFVNTLSAFLALGGISYYLFYSLLLKPKTPMNVVVGGGAGAVPPLVGWAAATSTLTMPAFFLFAVVFFWTPPHFWALALLRRGEYASAGIPMVPVVFGDRNARWLIYLHTIQVVLLTILLPVAQLGGWIFLLIALSSGAVLLHQARDLLLCTNTVASWRMYRYSNLYLALIFAGLVVDTFI
jgi:protoheme IX farnesyltransferase